VTLKVFCGPARATVRYRGKTYSFRNGSCVTVANALTVNVGVETFAHPPSTDAPRTSWFGATIFASRDGTYQAGSALTLSWSAPGFSFLFTAGTVHVSAGRSRGAFSGQFYGRGSFGGHGSFAAASGSFSC